MSFSEEEWKIIQDQENVVGENVRLAVDCVRHASSWWLIALRRRIQVSHHLALRQLRQTDQTPGRDNQQQPTLYQHLDSRMAYSSPIRPQRSLPLSNHRRPPRARRPNPRPDNRTHDRRTPHQTLRTHLPSPTTTTPAPAPPPLPRSLECRSPHLRSDFTFSFCDFR